MPYDRADTDKEFNRCSVCGEPTPYHTCSTDCTLQAIDTEDREDA